jgi:aldehyde dehydrogenase (NAD+)
MLLHRQVDKLVVGDPFDEATDIGPLASTDQHQTVCGDLELAQCWASPLAASRLLGVCFIAPTVLARVSSESRLVREEIFGPVLVVELVEDFDAALAAANDTEFGLSSALFTRDIAKAMKFIQLTQSGIVHINRKTAGVEPHVPFGGIMGSSSMSREQGKAAVQFFTTTKTVYLRSV